MFRVAIKTNAYEHCIPGILCMGIVNIVDNIVKAVWKFGEGIFVWSLGEFRDDKLILNFIHKK